MQTRAQQVCMTIISRLKPFEFSNDLCMTSSQIPVTSFVPVFMCPNSWLYFPYFSHKRELFLIRQRLFHCPSCSFIYMSSQIKFILCQRHSRQASNLTCLIIRVSAGGAIYCSSFPRAPGVAFTCIFTNRKNTISSRQCLSFHWQDFNRTLWLASIAEPNSKNLC